MRFCGGYNQVAAVANKDGGAVRVLRRIVPLAGMGGVEKPEKEES
jgi:hypothetical protein